MTDSMRAMELASPEADAPSARLRAKSRRLARAAAGFGLLLGVSVLVGWWFEIGALKSLAPTLVSMKANAAAGFALSGIALYCRVGPDSTSGRLRVARAAAMAVLALSLLTLAEHAFGIDLGLDELLATAASEGTRFPGRMAPQTALAFSLLGASLGLLDSRFPRLRRFAHAAAGLAFLIGLLAAVGYAYDVDALRGVPGYASMALHTAIGFLVVSGGVVAARPEYALGALLAQSNAVGAPNRRFLLGVLIGPFVVGWLCLRGQQAGLYDTAFGLALTATACIVLLGLVWIWNASAQQRALAEREEGRRDDAFLLALSDIVRSRSSAEQVLSEAATMLGVHLDVARCFFSEMDLVKGTGTTHHDYCRKLPSLAGTRPLAAYSASALAEVRMGRTIVSEDASIDPRTRAEYATSYGPAGLRARIVVPLLRAHDLIQALVASSPEPRAWAPREVSLVQSVAEKVWAWTEHLRLVDELRRREEDLTVTMNSIGDGIITTDAASRILRVNPVAERLTGFSASEALGRPLAEVFRIHNEETGATVESPVERVLRDGRVVELANHTVLVMRDGTERAISDSGSPMRQADGSVRGIVLTFRDESVARAKERALRESEERFRALVAASAQIVWTASETGEIVEDSASWRAFTGQSLEDWRQGKAMDAVHPDDRDELMAIWVRAIPAGTVMFAEFRIRRSDGVWRWFAMRAVPLLGPSGKVRQWVGMNVDITEQRAAAERKLLAERLEERGRFFDLSLDLVCIADGAAGHFLELNPAFTETLGFGRDELLQRPFLDFVHPDDLSATLDEVKSLATGAKTLKFSNRYRCKDGSYRSLQWRAAPGEAGLIYAVARDITEDLAVARVLAEGEERLRLLVESARDYAIFMLDVEGRVATWNNGAKRLTGYDAAEITGRHFSIFYPEEAREIGHPAHELESAKARGRYEEEGWRVRKDGTRFWANSVISAMRDHAGLLRGYAKVTRDFTERQKVLAELEAREVKLAAHLKEREVLLQEIHHRVKNNLQVIASLISMQARKVSDQASRSALEECKARVQAIALIHEKLYQSRDYSHIPFSEYARSLASNIFYATGTSPDSVALDLAIEPMALGVDKAIPCGLILNELITNALKHAFPGERPGQLRVVLRRLSGDTALLSVADDGVGMAVDFDIENAKSLGMQLVSTLAEQLEGQLEIAHDAGTTFSIKFQLSTDLPS